MRLDYFQWELTARITKENLIGSNKNTKITLHKRCSESKVF